MMTLTRSLEEDLARSAAMHRRLCPRQVIGVRLARLACTRLGIDPAVRRKQIYVYMECGFCVADAVIAVTGASPTNQRMQLMGYGKVAATFVDRRTGEALRIAERPESRELAVSMMPPDLSPWEAQLRAYQTMDDTLLLRWQHVTLADPLPQMPDKHAVLCDRCGEKINEHCEVGLGKDVLCKACAGRPYYLVQHPVVSTSGLMAANSQSIGETA